MADVFIGLGANIGDPETRLRRAVERLGEALEVVAVSSLYRTEPVGVRDQPSFMNAAIWVRTDMDPSAVHVLLQRLEDEGGRVRDVPMGPRTLDLDLLLYGSSTVDEPGLTVPHPRMAERRFVLEPLVEIAPDVRHPVIGSSLAEVLASLPPAEAVERLDVERWPP